jgi:hypothetical protein
MFGANVCTTNRCTTNVCSTNRCSVDKGVDNALWITPVDKVEVVPRLWIRL